MRYIDVIMKMPRSATNTRGVDNLIRSRSSWKVYHYASVPVAALKNPFPNLQKTPDASLATATPVKPAIDCRQKNTTTLIASRSRSVSRGITHTTKSMVADGGNPTRNEGRKTGSAGQQLIGIWFVLPIDDGNSVTQTKFSKNHVNAIAKTQAMQYVALGNINIRTPLLYVQSRIGVAHGSWQAQSILRRKSGAICVIELVTDVCVAVLPAHQPHLVPITSCPCQWAGRMASPIFNPYVAPATFAKAHARSTIDNPSNGATDATGYMACLWQKGYQGEAGLRWLSVEDDRQAQQAMQFEEIAL